jgi:hypothetical protein
MNPDVIIFKLRFEGGPEFVHDKFGPDPSEKL